jgi:archaellum component FlaF (FlaF/FlaG flagellin family)
LGKIINIFLIIAIFLVAATSVISADEDHVLVNSKDWRDVYSGILYSKLIGANNNFVGSVQHSSIVLGVISKTSNLLVVSSKEEPYLVGYKSTIKNLGFENVEEIVTRTSNIDLAKRLENINNFIIIDDAYGYNSISVASYAVISESYVLFANKNNINKITNFLEDKTAPNLIIFGNVDREVKDDLAIYNPEIINEADRFDNNLKIIDKYLYLKSDTRQVFLTNGEFIEDSLMSGNDPVIFIGKVNVPDQVREYIKKSQFQVATLIGNELIGVAQFIRQQIGIPVFVKFAQGARNPDGPISQVEDLDRFPMPKYNLLLSIYEIRYNLATRNLEVTYENKVNLGTYFKSTITVNTPEGDIVLGDEDVVFIDKGSYKTIVYPLDIIGEEDLRAQIYTLYGESRKSMENVLQATYDISVVKIFDDSQIELISLVYDKRTSEFILEITNNGEVDVSVSPELVDLFINDDYVNFGVEEPVRLKKGETKKVRIAVDELTEDDVIENDIIRVKAYYGQRETTLFKIALAEFKFEFKQANYYVYGIIIFLVLILLLFEFSKKKCPNCKHKNKRRAKRCTKCHHKF